MRLQLDGRARALLRMLPRTSVYSVAELVLLAVLAVQVARLLWAIVTPVSPVGDWRPPTVTIPADAAGLLTGFDPFFRSAPPAPAAVTALQLTLFGTRLDGASGRGSAIIAGSDKVQNSWSVGDEVAPGARLKAVYFDHVTFDRGGRDEDLWLDQSDASTSDDAASGDAPPPGAADGLVLGDVTPAAPSPGASLAPGKAIGAGALRSEIGFIPRIDGGRVSGLTVRPQGSGAAFRTAGLQPGDVVTAIGGRPVTGDGDIDRLAAQFPAGGSVGITVERGSSTLSLPIVIRP